MRGLYVVTDAQIDHPDRLHQQVSEAIDGGASWVQFRHKTDDEGLYRALADSVVECCRSNHTPCLINDRVEVAKVLHVAGVHLGQDDGDLSDARSDLGETAIIGRTCHNSEQLMENAVRDGVTYCAFGRLFESETKPGAKGLSLDDLKYLVKQCPIPTVAIGGINVDNAPIVLDTGVSMLAVSGAVFRARDIGDAARRLSDLF